MEATTEKNEYKLKDFLLDVFAKYKINIKKQDFDTILILEEDNKEFRAGRDLEEKEERYYASSDIKKPDFPDLRQLPAKEKYVFENENTMWIIFGKKDIKPTDECSTSLYQMFLGVLIRNQDALRYTFLFEYILGELVRNITDTAQALLQEEDFFKTFNEKRMLMQEYADWIINQYELPELRILNELSATKYERRECNARVYFQQKEKQTIERFGIQGQNNRLIKAGNLRMVRKLLEISNENGIDILAEKINTPDGKTAYAVQALLNATDDSDDVEQIYIKFKGYMHWSLTIGKREVLIYYHGEYQLGYAKEGENYLEDIIKLQKDNKLEQVDIQMLKDIVEVLKEQRHGTSVIFMERDEAEQEVKRLCDMNRAIPVESNLKYNKTEEGENGWHKAAFLGISNMDGALILDFDGNCKAISCIVDGKAVIPGRVERGARLNSIENYVGSKKKGICIGIVISEDGMVNNLHNKNPKYGESQKKNKKRG